MNSLALAAAAARSIRPRAARGAYSAMFSAMVPANSVGRWGTQAIRARQCSGSSSRRSTPAQVMRPSVGSARRISSLAIVLLPAPLGPTRAAIRPGSRTSSTPASTGPGRCGYS